LSQKQCQLFLCTKKTKHAVDDEKHTDDNDEVTEKVTECKSNTRNDGDDGEHEHKSVSFLAFEYFTKVNKSLNCDENAENDQHKVEESVAKNENQYFAGYDGNVSFNNSGTDYTISKSGSGFTISHTERIVIWSTTYYLKQTDNSVSMSSGDNGNDTWQFYEVKKEYKVVE
jgi:hypothetical protein